MFGCGSHRADDNRAAVAEIVSDERTDCAVDWEAAVLRDTCYTAPSMAAASSVLEIVLDPAAILLMTPGEFDGVLHVTFRV